MEGHRTPFLFGNYNGAQCGALAACGRPNPQNVTVGFRSIQKFLYMSAGGISHLKILGLWKEINPGRTQTLRVGEDHLNFGATNYGPSED